jgi:hypothetical protein
MSRSPLSRLPSEGASILRRGSSRVLGVTLILTSALLFVAAFVTSFLPFELGSLISFVLGVALLAVELEPRVRLSVAAEGMQGYIHAMDGALHAANAEGKATYVPHKNQATMAFEVGAGNSRLELPQVGAGLNDEFLKQLGDMEEKGLDYFSMWVPKALVDNLAAAEDVKVARDGDRVSVTMSKPFVRRLCVDPFVNANVCCRMGCPLAGAVAGALAVTTGKEVRFDICSYDPKAQRASTSLQVTQS